MLAIKRHKDFFVQIMDHEGKFGSFDDFFGFEAIFICAFVTHLSCQDFDHKASSVLINRPGMQGSDAKRRTVDILVRPDQVTFIAGGFTSFHTIKRVLNAYFMLLAANDGMVENGFAAASGQDLVFGNLFNLY